MARFVRNRAFEREISATPEFQRGLEQTTLRVEDAIETAAQPFRGTGQFIRKVKARKTRVYLEPHFAHLAEYGSVNNPPQANVRRGVKAAGLRYEDSGPSQAE